MYFYLLNLATYAPSISYFCKQRQSDNQKKIIKYKVLPLLLSSLYSSLLVSAVQVMQSYTPPTGYESIGFSTLRSPIYIIIHLILGYDFLSLFFLCRPMKWLSLSWVFFDSPTARHVHRHTVTLLDKNSILALSPLLGISLYPMAIKVVEYSSLLCWFDTKPFSIYLITYKTNLIPWKCYKCKIKLQQVSFVLVTIKRIKQDHSGGQKMAVSILT